MRPSRGWTLRRAAVADAAALAAVHVAGWGEAYAGLVPDHMLAALSVDSRAATWARILAERAQAPATTVHVACDAGRIVGFAASGAQRSAELRERFEGEVSAIYVLRRAQGQGIGRALMATAARDLLAGGLGGAALWVLRDNWPARRFYEHLGGEPAAERTDRRGDVCLAEVAYGWRALTLLAQD